MMCTVCSAEDEIKGHEQRTQKRGHSGLPRMPPDIQGLGRPGPGPALGASGRVTIELEEHGGYFCAGCKRSWTSLVSLNHHRASPYMRGTECEEENNLNLNLNSRELRKHHSSSRQSCQCNGTIFEAKIRVLGQDLSTVGRYTESRCEYA
jgi:hypothetical protein